jgi:hypothetical protein
LPKNLPATVGSFHVAPVMLLISPSEISGPGTPPG